MSKTHSVPGRLGDPNMSLQTDPRTNPKLLACLTTLGLHQTAKSDPVGSDRSSIKALLAATAEGVGRLYDTLPNDLPEDAQEAAIVQTTTTITGDSGNAVALHFFRRASVPTSTRLPAVLYVHGGGMTILETLNRVHIRWARSLALEGLAVVLVDFRNAWSAGAWNPFPAGLSDVAAAARHLASHRDEHGLGALILQGESGGGNLALATALRAKREGWVHEIAGVWAGVPFISGAYGWDEAEKRAQLPSLVEVEGYFLDQAMMAAQVEYYTPDQADRTNPEAWPYHAPGEDLRGLPPHVLCMDELDPLRDEGVAYYRKLAAAGVEVTAEVNLGVVHATGLIFRQAVPEVHRKAVGSVAAFAKRL